MAERRRWTIMFLPFSLCVFVCLSVLHEPLEYFYWDVQKVLDVQLQLTDGVNTIQDGRHWLSDDFQKHKNVSVPLFHLDYWTCTRTSITQLIWCVSGSSPTHSEHQQVVTFWLYLFDLNLVINIIHETLDRFWWMFQEMFAGFTITNNYLLESTQFKMAPTANTQIVYVDC